MRGIIFTC
jgi:hypothetical protein